MAVSRSHPMMDPYQAFASHLPAGLIMYDVELRVVVAEGELLRSTGYLPEKIRGELLSDVLPASVFPLLETRYRDGLAGIDHEWDHRSPADGNLYRVRIRSLRDGTGAVSAALLLIWDVTERGLLQAQLAQARNLVDFGSAVYQRNSGWSMEASLLDLWGATEGASPQEASAELIVEGDRLRAEQAWEQTLRTGGPIGLEYSIRHGRTGELRHLHGTTQAHVAPDGTLLRAETTHVDVTDIVAARKEAQLAEAARVRQRDLLFQQVSALLATSPPTETDSVAQTLQAIAELAATVIGDGCILRSADSDGSSFAPVAAAHRTVEGRRRLEEWTRHGPTELATMGAPVRRAMDSREGSSAQVDEDDLDYPPWLRGVRYVLAPALHRGEARGSIALIRPGDGPPFDDADLDLVRLIADRVGALLEAERADAWGRRLAAELEQVNADQRELVLQLDSTESRERRRLADAVHDEPLQLSVAAMLRLDSYRAQLADSDPGGQVIDDIADMLETCAGQLRTLIGTITPPDLSQGLGPALRRLAEGIFIGTKVQIHVRGPDHVHLDPKTKETVYRVLREGLLNARKHAHATMVTLDLSQTDEVVTLRLADDGVGIIEPSPSPDAGRTLGHLGMSSMRARASAANAQLTIEGAPGAGTVVELVVPRHEDLHQGQVMQTHHQDPAPSILATPPVEHGG